VCVGALSRVRGLHHRERALAGDDSSQLMINHCAQTLNGFQLELLPQIELCLGTELALTRSAGTVSGQQGHAALKARA